ncbi:MAG TPA: hypothetical protein DCQ14_06250 [Firmicutes bacterium]|nr:hypothetical protein [Bacillota bacterium]
MKTLHIIGLVLTLIGGVFILIIGLTYLAGRCPLYSFAGLTGLTLGIGLFLFVLSQLFQQKTA